MTPLFRAIQREDLELIKLLMDEGFADCDFKNQVNVIMIAPVCAVYRVLPLERAQCLVLCQKV